MSRYHPAMPKGRLEAFSDGVIAILITIMVLELRAPHSTDLQSLREVMPAFLCYVLSFIYLGIYWNNHHHLFHAVQRVSGMTLWGNLHLLFWLSLVPFVTSWMGENHFETWPVVLYGVVLLMCGVAWEIERRILLLHHPSDTALSRAVSRSMKEWVSLGLYAVAIAGAFINVWIAIACYYLVAAIWFIPDRRIEHALDAAGHPPSR
jgi:TMEM175 potassium channel family protein